jgi:uncharacterized protein GlcG (DUF336 family)
MKKRLMLCAVTTALLVVTPLIADDDDNPGKAHEQQEENRAGQSGVNCQGLPSNSQLRTWLQQAYNQGNAGGLFQGQYMWGAVVNRDGELCSYTTSTTDPSLVWPGSQAIAKAKAFTANAFSNDSTPLSTARLYTLTQPGHSLWSLGLSNLFDSSFLAPNGGQGGGTNQIVGGMIFFGGGVPLYNNGKVIGGLGVSGDTSCTDHEIAKRVRNQAGLNPPGGMLADDITYTVPDGASVFTHPKCVNTWRNGVSLGTELPAVGY